MISPMSNVERFRQLFKDLQLFAKDGEASIKKLSADEAKNTDSADFLGALMDAVEELTELASAAGNLRMRILDALGADQGGHPRRPIKKEAEAEEKEKKPTPPPPAPTPPPPTPARAPTPPPPVGPQAFPQPRK